MRYLCLVYLDDAKLDALGPDAWDALMGETLACDDDLRASGLCLASGALQPVEMALTVRVGSGGVTAVDGPSSDEWRQIGWFALLEARDLNEAIRVAARLPPARLGSVEVRPLAEPVPWAAAAWSPRIRHLVIE